MFGAGWTEMLIIGIVALVVIGPKDLPVVMRKIGRVVGTVRRMGTEFQRELNKTTGLDQITDLKRSLTEPLRQTSEEIAREFNKVTATGIEPTGIVKPADPKVESVYEQIAATSGVGSEAAAPPMMKSLASSEPSPAPAEASVLPPAPAKPKRVAKPKGVAETPAAAPARKPAARKTAAKTPKPAEITPTSEIVAPAPKPRARSAAKTAAAVAPTATAVAAKPVRSRAKKA